jgi:spore coat polysaccharide biosynthesis predicted glycosyltransferase SpsG
LPNRPDLIRLVVTAGSHEGRGHLSRALALAGALRRLDPAATIGLTVLRGEATARQAARVAELGVAVEFGSALDGVPGDAPELDVIDLPDPNEIATRFRRSAGHGHRLVVFDDRELLTGTADVVVQPSLPTWSGRAAADVVLAGYRYVPIDEGYVGLTGLDVRGTDRPTVFVCFGGSDPDDVTGRLAPAIAADPRWEAEVVVGAGYRARQERLSFEPIRDPPDLVDRLARCDIAVTAAGTMKFEAACLGRPTLIVGAADDQLAVGPPFASTGAARWLGDGRDVDRAAVVAAIAELASDVDGRMSMAARARATVDGRGAERIAQAMIGSAESPADL